MAGAGGRRGPGLVALAVGVPVVAAGTVIVLAFAGAGPPEPGPLHRDAAAYLEAVGGGGAAIPAARPACPADGPDPAAELRRLAGAFGHRIVSSGESGDTAHLDADLLPPGGAEVAVVLDLRRSEGRWQVCAVTTGRTAIDPF
ncbi:hypothetical protein [Streptomyces sp. NPDC097619]|uniref:hypothetical protein n=1 Tax=Streptomyces sp. NPDC097619 TaxID=3157228 RepID=UPI0033306D88